MEPTIRQEEEESYAKHPVKDNSLNIYLLACIECQLNTQYVAYCILIMSHPSHQLIQIFMMCVMYLIYKTKRLNQTKQKQTKAAESKGAFLFIVR